ncbi:hypothetical protein NBE99_12720 [Thermosynechococcus sp. HN-54]|uniref:hypothetical protein n=1 Tax=Thermosynechococcus sp. HN-54 TaxID=2933959 RepID=UPI00202CFB13|nr:hypothetical protein [Thermosynechococcus sp. HN-54]URR35479.1 hypothetical protein NBE99_12720 [Thermosynechococcus sp. HN-54]
MENCSLSKKKEFAYRLRERALKEKNPYQKALLAEVYATYNIRNLVPIAEDLELERSILLSLRPNDFDPVILNHDFVHIITETYETGGHTRLLTATVREQIKQNQDVAVFVTRRVDPLTLNFLNQIKCKVYCLGGKNKFFELVTKGKVMSHIHHFDIYTAVSLWFSKEKYHFDIYFINHADHVFNYGHSICNSILEVSGYGYYRTEALKHYQAHHLVGIPLNTVHLKKIQYRPNYRSNDQKFFSILTIAGGDKLRPTQEWNYPLFINQLLDNFDNNRISITIIGQSGEEPWWKKGYVSQKKLEKVKFIKSLPYEKLYKDINLYDAYLDSFPFTGGTVISEIAAIGVPIYAPKLPCQGYSIADKVRSDSLDIVMQGIKDHILDGKLPYDTQSLAFEVQSFHHPSSYLNRLMNIINDRGIKVPSILLNFKPDILFLEKAYATEWIEGLPNLPRETSPVNRIKLLIYSLEKRDSSLTVTKLIKTVLSDNHPILIFLKRIKSIYQKMVAKFNQVSIDKPVGG